MRPTLQLIVTVSLLVLLLSPMISPIRASTGEYYPTAGWRTSTPEAQGMTTKKLQEMNDYIRVNGVSIDGVVVIRHGYLVWEYYPNTAYDANTIHYLYSVTKSFTSCLIGIALDKGYIHNTSQRMVSFFPDRTIANLDDRKQRITLENLLMMKSGMRWDESSAPFTDPRNDIYHILHEDGLQWCLDLETDSEPGTYWRYNTGASHILSGIVTASTGASTLKFAEENLFKPLGITHYSWATDPGGTVIGGFDLQLSPRDMAKFGYLYLHGGQWDGEQIVPEAWVEKSTSTLTQPYATLGYGYQWWTTPSQNLYSARGLYNQMIYVLPDLDTVIAITANMRSGGTDNYITDYILPSITEYNTQTPPATQSQGIPGYPTAALATGIGLATLIILIEAKPRKPDDPHGEDTGKPPTFRTHHLTR